MRTAHEFDCFKPPRYSHSILRVAMSISQQVPSPFDSLTSCRSSLHGFFVRKWDFLVKYIQPVRLSKMDSPGWVWVGAIESQVSTVE